MSLIITPKTTHLHTTQDTTGWNQPTCAFQALGSRRVEVDFSGGHLSSDGGALLLREADRSLRLCSLLADCFTDFRDQDFVEHDWDVLLRQRIPGRAPGYEDINDHERLRRDPLMAAMCGRADWLGLERTAAQDKGQPLAGKSTLNRLAPGAQEINSRTKKIQAHPEKIEALLLERGVAAMARKSDVIVLDFDATDDPIHGHQEGAFYHGYHRAYCNAGRRRARPSGKGSALWLSRSARLCRSPVFAATSRSGRSSAPPTALARMARSRRSKRSSPPFANASGSM